MTRPAVLLVRHTEVAGQWRGRCYGVTDVGLSRTGQAAIPTLADTIRDWRPDRIVHSGLKRTRCLAVRVAAIAAVPIEEDSRWRERDFGAWEGQTWAAIYRATGNAMDGMIDAPATFRPGGGETTDALAVRSLAALAALPAGRIAVITHGGPIAAITGTLQDRPPREWPALVPQTGRSIELSVRSTRGEHQLGQLTEPDRSG